MPHSPHAVVASLLAVTLLAAGTPPSASGGVRLARVAGWGGTALTAIHATTTRAGTTHAGATRTSTTRAGTTRAGTMRAGGVEGAPGAGGQAPGPQVEGEVEGASRATPAAAAGGGRVLAAGGGRVPPLRLPVPGTPVRAFDPGSGPYSAGHRGLDLAAGPGEPVMAPAPGTVTFAGPAGGEEWVTVDVAPGVRTSLGPLATAEVRRGQEIGSGTRLGRLAAGHDGALHLGLRIDGVYADPAPYLVRAGRPRLAPLPQPGPSGAATIVTPSRTLPPAAGGPVAGVPHGPDDDELVPGPPGIPPGIPPGVSGPGAAGEAAGGAGLAAGSAPGSAAGPAPGSAAGPAAGQVPGSPGLGSAPTSGPAPGLPEAPSGSGPGPGAVPAPGADSGSAAASGPAAAAPSTAQRSGLGRAWRGLSGLAGAAGRGLAGVVGAAGRGVRAQAGAVLPRLALPGMLLGGAWQLWERSCGPGRARTRPGPPNGNLAVGVAGIASSTTKARKLDLTGLGYRPEDITYYSYRGLPDPGEPGIEAAYGPEDTLGSLRAAGHRLYDQLAALHAAHPDRAVDLIAHSQGGIVAAYFMAYLYDPDDPMLPRVDHMITLATPHQGADLATTVTHLRTTPRGRRLLAVIEPVTRKLGLGIRADSVALTQLAEDSQLIRQLNGRVLQRATAVRGGFDVVVTTAHAGRPDLPGRASCATHGGILADERARRTVLAALRNESLPPPGPGGDQVPRVVGGAIEHVEDTLGEALERWAGYRPVTP